MERQPYPRDRYLLYLKNQGPGVVSKNSPHLRAWFSLPFRKYFLLCHSLWVGLNLTVFYSNARIWFKHDLLASYPILKFDGLRHSLEKFSTILPYFMCYLYGAFNSVSFLMIALLLHYAIKSIVGIVFSTLFHYIHYTTFDHYKLFYLLKYIVSSGIRIWLW